MKQIEERKSYAAITKAMLEGALSPFQLKNMSKFRHPTGRDFRAKGGVCGDCILREPQGHGRPLRCGLFMSYMHGEGTHTRSVWHACDAYERDPDKRKNKE